MEEEGQEEDNILLFFSKKIKEKQQQRIIKFILSKLKLEFGVLNVERAMQNLKTSSVLSPEVLKTKLG